MTATLEGGQRRNAKGTHKKIFKKTVSIIVGNLLFLILLFYILLSWYTLKFLSFKRINKNLYFSLGPSITLKNTIHMDKFLKIIILLSMV